MWRRVHALTGRAERSGKKGVRKGGVRKRSMAQEETHTYIGHRASDIGLHGKQSNTRRSEAKRKEKRMDEGRLKERVTYCLAPWDMSCKHNSLARPCARAQVCVK